MSAPFKLPTVSLALALATVIGATIFGVLASASPAQTVPPLQISPAVAKQLLVLVGLGYFAGALGWLAIFCMRRDGWHRLEWVALLPFNYGGRNPFDLSPPPPF